MDILSTSSAVTNSFRRFRSAKQTGCRFCLFCFVFFLPLAHLLLTFFIPLSLLPPCQEMVEGCSGGANREGLCVSKENQWKWIRVTAPWSESLSRFTSAGARMCQRPDPCDALLYLCIPLCCVVVNPFLSLYTVLFLQSLGTASVESRERENGV